MLWGSVRVALPALGHEVPGSNPAEGRFQLKMTAGAQLFKANDAVS